MALREHAHVAADDLPKELARRADPRARIRRGLTAGPRLGPREPVGGRRLPVHRARGVDDQHEVVPHRRAALPRDAELALGARLDLLAQALVETGDDQTALATLAAGDTDAVAADVARADLVLATGDALPPRPRLEAVLFHAAGAGALPRGADLRQAAPLVAALPLRAVRVGEAGDADTRALVAAGPGAAGPVAGRGAPQVDGDRVESVGRPLAADAPAASRRRNPQKNPPHGQSCHRTPSLRLPDHRPPHARSTRPSAPPDSRGGRRRESTAGPAPARSPR